MDDWMLNAIEFIKDGNNILENNKAVNTFTESFKSMISGLTDWELEMIIQEIFCKNSRHPFNEENMKYEDEIQTNNHSQCNDQDGNLIKEIRSSKILTIDEIY